jgi:hypothetical protein
MCSDLVNGQTRSGQPRGAQLGRVTVVRNPVTTFAATAPGGSARQADVCLGALGATPAVPVIVGQLRVERR